MRLIHRSELENYPAAAAHSRDWASSARGTLRTADTVITSWSDATALMGGNVCQMCHIGGDVQCRGTDREHPAYINPGRGVKLTASIYGWRAGSGPELQYAANAVKWWATGGSELSRLLRGAWLAHGGNTPQSVLNANTLHVFNLEVNVDSCMQLLQLEAQPSHVICIYIVYFVYCRWLYPTRGWHQTGTAPQLIWF